MTRPTEGVTKLTPTCQVCDTTKGLIVYPSGMYCKDDAPLDTLLGRLSVLDRKRDRATLHPMEEAEAEQLMQLANSAPLLLEACQAVLATVNYTIGSKDAERYKPMLALVWDAIRAAEGGRQ